MREQLPLRVEAVTHRYEDQAALAEVNLEIARGEFFTLLGPSGCGKTTLLRIVGGFVRPSEGRVVLEGADITADPAHKRPVNMVFQRPTLFPNLDVFNNVAFGLRIERQSKKEIAQRVAEALRLVRLDGYERRRADELSGGQMQRVALARALVKRPAVLLLDEPLSALDLRIRLEMEQELRRVHRETGATFVYVTHDQREALALSDRLAVFDHGHVEQVGSPEAIYNRPDSPFVARFVGGANVIPVQIVGQGADEARVRVGPHELAVASNGSVPGPDAWLVLRPEVVRLTVDREISPPDGLPGVVADLAFRGTGFSYSVDVVGLDEPVKAEIASAGSTALELGSMVRINWQPSACVLLARQSDAQVRPDSANAPMRRDD